MDLCHTLFELLNRATGLRPYLPRALPWARGFCPLPFRYAPVTVGSGRVGKTCESSLINLIVQKIIVKNISPKIFLFKKIFVT